METAGRRLIKNSCMWRYLGLVVVVGLACACSTPNPRSCADGACSDPALPFCDVDGSIAGAPLACIAVSCTPAEVAVCRGNEAVACNSTGDDYDVVACPLGCNIAVGGCRACATNNDCTASAPICDQATSQCRGCELDNECESSVCGQGSCVPSSSVVYASANGSNVAAGTIADPGSISRALGLAFAGGGTPKIVRLLPGAYNTPIEMLSENLMQLEIVATGATITASDTGVRVSGGAKVRIRGLAATAGNQAVMCGASGTLRTTLTIDDAVLFENGGGGNAFVVTTNCSISMTNVESRSTSTQANVLFFGSGSRFVGDRLHVKGNDSAIYTLGFGVSVRLTNSILEDVSLVLNTSDTQIPGSEAYLGFNTIVLQTSLRDIYCDPSTVITALFENNIIVVNGATAAVSGTGCSLVNNVLLPQPSAPAGNITLDPQFVDSAAKNFRLRSTSPALGAASVTPTIFTDHDFEGNARPQGAGADIGAFEQ